MVPAQRLLDMQNRLSDMESDLAAVRSKLAEAEQATAIKAAEVAAYATAFERVGEAASYRLAKGPEESWPDYKRRVLEVLEQAKDTDAVKAILDLLTFRLRETYRSWLAAKDPVAAEQLRLEARGIQGDITFITRSMAFRDGRTRREADLWEAKDFAAMDLDEKRLAAQGRAREEFCS